jgi:hypothetical protein
MSTVRDSTGNQPEDDNASGILVTKSDAASETSAAPDAETDAKKEEPPLGSVTDTVELYAKIDQDGNQSWTSTIPEDVEEAAENEETKKFAVIVRKRKPKVADSTRPLVIDSLIIQSPHLKAILSKVLEGYPGIVTDVKRLTLNAPFQPILHRWEAFSNAVKDDSLEPIARDHAALLHSILADELGDLIQLREDYLRNKAVSFQHAWTLFQPGCTVFASKNGHPTAFTFDHGYYGETSCGKAYLMQAKYMEFDGTRMGWTTVMLQIRDFVGTMPFSSLAVFPLEHHPEAEAMTERLLARGRRFRLLAGFRYKAYKGTAIWHIDENTTRREDVDSRIVVDGANWERNNNSHQVYVSTTHTAEYTGNDCHDISEEEAARLYPITRDQLLKASPMVRGYALKNKRWMEFFIDDVSDIEFNAAAFGSLVLPADHKDLVLAFAESQVKNKNNFDDVISGKGKGVIMLLSGGPGIGKTLTAESVAEHMRVPLYSMSGGDLGADATEVEENLSNVLAMVAHWNAVLLLDECDVFLQERGLQDMERNRMVSIFLRTLEYYEGILFLTTNRATSIDPAFESRIHISLEYPPLDAEARVAIWRGFLGRADDVVAGKSHAVTPDEVTQLSELNLNGRQIKNILKTANLLACHRSDVLSMEHLRTVLKVKGHSL